MSSVETLAPTLQLDEIEDLKGNLGRDVHYFLLFVVDVVIGSIAWGVLTCCCPCICVWLVCCCRHHHFCCCCSAALLLSGVLSDNTDDVEAVSSLDDEDLLLVIAVRTWLADAK